jgi:ankyrin repeat protein
VHPPRSLGKTALHLALEQGSEAAASALLAAGDLDVKSYDKGGTSLLISSLSSQMWGVSKQLLGRGADPSRADRQKTAPLHALCAACAGGSYSAADDGVDLTAASGAPLSIPCKPSDQTEGAWGGAGGGNRAGSC